MINRAGSSSFLQINRRCKGRHTSQTKQNASHNTYKMMRLLQIVVLALAAAGTIANTPPPGCNDPACQGIKASSGYIDVSSTKHMFYWSFASVSAPTTDPLVIWFNGVSIITAITRREFASFARFACAQPYHFAALSAWFKHTTAVPNAQRTLFRRSVVSSSRSLGGPRHTACTARRNKTTTLLKKHERCW
jgi:hypothetical protein